MNCQDWLVRKDGVCEPCQLSKDWEWREKTYRLYRFLTDLEDILSETKEEEQILSLVRPLVRRLLTSSYWIQGEYTWPDAQQGWSVFNLYDEMNFPLTLQMVVWLPGQVSKIHNHGTWGLVALISGEEKNTFWRRDTQTLTRDHIQNVGEKRIGAGDIISFTSEAIHSIEVIGEEPVVSFNLYGETNYEQRWQFDPLNQTAKNF
jgi:predicted metal-dependent enzyme (double-stranded beta helix superfamily)